MKVKLGLMANVFYDMATNFYIVKGETKELTPKLKASNEIRKAIHGGHLVVVDDKEKAPEPTVEPETPETQEPTVDPQEIAELKAAMDEMLQANKTVKEITDAFNKEQLILLAPEYGVEVENGDTKAQIVEAIIG